MAYRKRRYYPRRKKRNTRWQNYKAGLGQLWKDVKWLKSVVNVEKKYVDASGNPTISTTATFVLLNGLAEGSDSTERTGDSVKFISQLLRLKASIHASATATTLRVFVIKDRQPNGAVFSLAELLSASTNIISPISMIWSKRFLVMTDKFIKLNQDFPEKTFKVFRKLRFHTRYGTNTSGVASISTNTYYLVLWSDEATNTPTVEYYNRLRFIDN